MTAKISDILNLFSKITFHRFFNSFKILSGYYFSRLSRKNHTWGMPMSVAIEPTTTCNLACPECPSGLKKFTRETGSMDELFFQKIIDQLSAHSFYLTLYFQGEPYIHPKFFDLVKYASERKMYISTSTNAHFLDDDDALKTVESGLDRIIISIDGTTQDAYQSYRINGKLDRVLEGTKNILKWKKKLKSKTPYVIFQFIVFKQNEHQVEEIKKLGKELGVDEVKIKTAQFYDYRKGNERIPQNIKYSRYSKISKDSYLPPLGIEEGLCWRMWHSCVITWDGLVIPCCFDKDAKYQLGDFKKDSFEKIWRNEKYNSFRTSFVNSRNEMDICANCTDGAKVWT